MVSGVGTCVDGHQLLPDDGHLAGRGAGRVEAAAVGAAGRVWTVRAPVGHLLVVAAPVEAAALVGYTHTHTNTLGF